MLEPYVTLIVIMMAIVVLNWLQHIMFVFIVKYLIIFHNLMQLTNIDDHVIIRISSITFWSVSLLVIIFEYNFTIQVQSTFAYLIILNGYLVIRDTSSVDLVGYGISILGILSVFVFCIVQIRIELGRIHYSFIFPTSLQYLHDENTYS